MREKSDNIRNADLHRVIPSHGRKSAVTVFTPHQDEIIDAEAYQRARDRIEPRMCAPVVIA